MAASIAWLSMLAVFSGLSMNLILHFGFGLRKTALTENTGPAADSGFNDKYGSKEIPIGLGVLFFTVILLWPVFSFIRSVVSLGLFEYVLLFPVCSLVFSLLENLARGFILKKIVDIEETNNSAFGGGVLASAALFITLTVSGGFSETLVLALGFTLGILLANAIVGEVSRRSEMEAVPRFLRGGPLVLITMGLLSLVFSSTAMMFFELLGAP